MKTPKPAPGSTEYRISTGVTAPGFEPVKALLDRFLLEDESYSAQLAAYWHGERVIDLWGGPDSGEDSITGVFSVSKGVSALCVARMVSDGDLDLDQTVTHYWPEFGCEGKENVLVRELLSHQVGLFAPVGTTIDDYLDSSVLAYELAQIRPSWRPGAMFGYHAMTMGVFMEELVRRIHRASLQSFFDELYRRPYEADFFLGLPESEDQRFREVLPPTPDPAAPIPGPETADALAEHAFSGVNTQKPPLAPNVAAVRRAGPAAAGGVGSARGLATLYAAASTGVNGSEPVASRHALDLMAQEQVYGVDRILHDEIAFGVVFMKPQPRIPFASHLAFGHDGAGGALGFADPMYGLAFGYVPQRMDTDERAVQRSAATRRCIRNLSTEPDRANG